MIELVVVELDAKNLIIIISSIVANPGARHYGNTFFCEEKLDRLAMSKIDQDPILSYSVDRDYSGKQLNLERHKNL